MAATTQRLRDATEIEVASRPSTPHRDPVRELSKTSPEVRAVLEIHAADDVCIRHMVGRQAHTLAAALHEGDAQRVCSVNPQHDPVCPRGLFLCAKVFLLNKPSTHGRDALLDLDEELVHVPPIETALALIERASHKVNHLRCRSCIGPVRRRALPGVVDADQASQSMSRNETARSRAPSRSLHHRVRQNGPRHPGLTRAQAQQGSLTLE